MKWSVVALSVFFSAQCCLAQADGRSITFHPRFGDAMLELGKEYRSDDTVQVTIETLRFYVSNIRLKRKGTTVCEEHDSYHLLDLADSTSLSFQLHCPYTMAADTIAFLLGIDSATNVSGALGGHLDPTKGMYWAWQSGYINFKLEGSSAVCPTKDKRFQLHLGGYMPPFAAAKEVFLPLRDDGPMNVYIDLKQLLTHIDLSTQRSIMSPSAEAVRLSGLASNIFTVGDEK